MDRLPQSNVIFFFLFAAFFVFITLRGELPKYLGFVLSSAPSGSTSQSSSNGFTDTLGQVTSAALPVIQTASLF